LYVYVGVKKGIQSIPKLTSQKGNNDVGLRQKVAWPAAKIIFLAFFVKVIVLAIFRQIIVF
jgi:hypothetical protein